MRVLFINNSYKQDKKGLTLLKNMSIKQKLIMIMVIPLIFESYNKTQNLTKLEKVIVFSTKISALVHETQKERGFTAGFLGAKGNDLATLIHT